MTTQQLALDLSPLIEPDYTPDLTLSQRFDLFHSANPWVADALESLAADWLAHGHSRVGVKALAEVIRWQYGRSTVDGAAAFKVNNSYVSRYARLMLERHPEWARAIETRELRAA